MSLFLYYAEHYFIYIRQVILMTYAHFDDWRAPSPCGAVYCRLFAAEGLIATT